MTDTTSQKQRYRYKFRTFADPPEYYSMEAGPFTPQQAAGFGSNEANKRTEVTGKTWVWDYEPIVDAEEALSIPGRPFFFIVGAVLAFIVWSIFMLQQRADDICRERARAGVTLCRGQVSAVNMFDEIECECREKP